MFTTLAYLVSVQKCPHAVPDSLHVARWLLGENSAVVPGTSGVVNKPIPWVQMASEDFVLSLCETQSEKMAYRDLL